MFIFIVIILVHEDPKSNFNLSKIIFLKYIFEYLKLFFDKVGCYQSHYILMNVLLHRNYKLMRVVMEIILSYSCTFLSRSL